MKVHRIGIVVTKNCTSSYICTTPYSQILLHIKVSFYIQIQKEIMAYSYIYIVHLHTILYQLFYSWDNIFMNFMNFRQAS